MAVITALPAPSLGLGDGSDQPPTAGATLRTVTTAVAQTTAAVDATVDHVLTTAGAAVRQAAPHAAPPPQERAATTTPQTDPPLHGTNDHGQGSVAVVDLTPTNERPVGGDPAGSDAGPEDIVVGRSRGEQGSDGKYHGHVTIAALFGNEILGSDSTEGQTTHGPLQPIQANVLDPLCNGSGQQICLSLLTADSSTTSTGSTNDFAVARAQLGGASGIGVGAAESHGTISQDPNCQTSTGTAKTANVSAGGGAVANVANSSSSSKSCRGQAPQVSNTSQVLGLGGTNVPIPAQGCADGTPDTVSGIPTLLPIVCNADTVAGASAVREALDVFVLNAGGTSLAKETTGASESVSSAPAETSPAQCADGVDNDGDGLIDAADPGCHTDGNAGNPSSYDANDNDESNPAAPVGGQGGKTPTKGAGNPSNKNNNNGNGNPGANGNGGPQCSDGVDNDGDGLVDARDPGCHSDGNPNNPNSFNPNDNSEGGGGPVNAAGSLPFTGSDVLQLIIGGLLLAAGGLVLRRRAGLHRS